jgi:hypothetical protein
MNRLNHSPGPWKLLRLPEAGKIYIQTITSHVVCEISTFPRQRAPAANAQFISAAPEMFEVLTTLLSILNEEHVGSKIWNKMNRAIKKAKGNL